MRFYEIICWIGFIEIIISFGVLAIVQQKHALRYGGAYQSLTKKLNPQDIKLLKIGVLFLFTGILLLIIAAFTK